MPRCEPERLHPNSLTLISKRLIGRAWEKGLLGANEQDRARCAYGHALRSQTCRQERRQRKAGEKVR